MSRATTGTAIWTSTPGPGDRTFFGGTYPALTWADYMTTATEGQPVRQFPDPAYVNKEEVPQPEPTMQESQEPTDQPSPTPTETPKPKPWPRIKPKWTRTTVPVCDGEQHRF